MLIQNLFCMIMASCGSVKDIGTRFDGRCRIEYHNSHTKKQIFGIASQTLMVCLDVLVDGAWTWPGQHQKMMQYDMD